MPQRHYIHVVGFQVPSDKSYVHEPLVVMLDHAPGEEWRAVFQLCVEELPQALSREAPRLLEQEIHVLLSQPPQRRLAADIREFVDRINRMTFLREGSRAKPGPAS